MKILRLALCTAALPAFAVTPDDVVKTDADIAAAKYQVSLTTAQTLQAAVNAFIAARPPDTQQAAKTAWLAARVPYQQTEVCRFGNPIVDDWEGRVNAWPLDEGLIDYVDTSYSGPSEENPLSMLNIVSTPKFPLSGTEIDATSLVPALISGTSHAADGIISDAACGDHAIASMLWGQDLYGTGPTAQAPMPGPAPSPPAPQTPPAPTATATA